MPILIQNTNQVMVGLGTFTFTIPAAGIYYVKGESTEVPPSGLVLVVNKNGTPVYTEPVITPTQSAFQFRTSFTCAASDAITVVLSSSAAVDNQKNTVKTIISIGQGE